MIIELRKITVEDVRKLNPCYDPADRVPEDFSGTVIDILKLEGVSADDKIWVVSRFLSDKRNRLFAVWCAREALKLVEKPDPRSTEACDVAERFANGEATEEELAAARAAARAAWDAALDAREAARDAALGAAWAAREAARAARAAWDAARAARAAWAARDAQIKTLIKMVEENGE